jgi:hypothetical protein
MFFYIKQARPKSVASARPIGGYAVIAVSYTHIGVRRPRSYYTRWEKKWLAFSKF